MTKPVGTFVCRICQEEKKHCLWDGTELYADPCRSRWTCGDLCCGANVHRISELPKLDYLAGRGLDILTQANLLSKEVVSRLVHFPGDSQSERFIRLLERCDGIALDHPLSKLILAERDQVEQMIIAQA